MKSRLTFVAAQSQTGSNAGPRSDVYFDIYEDWDLIDATFAMQYHINLADVSTTMPYFQFIARLKGIMAETPLGRIVGIRAEKDSKVIKGFTADQKRIYSHWRDRSAKKLEDNGEALKVAQSDLSDMMRIRFGRRVKE